jgi:NAD+ kinase
MFNKVLIVTKSGLEGKGKKVLEDVRKKLGNRSVFIADSWNLRKRDVEGFDLIITIGGDGTFLSAANLVEDTYILGINSDPDRSEGFLSSLLHNELEYLDEILKGYYEIYHRHRARVILNGRVLDEHALNEVYVGSIQNFHTSRYKIRHRNFEEEHRSAGVIVSTGTGSTAWFNSAGGEIFGHDEERLSFIVREPYVGKRIFKPKITKGTICGFDSLYLKSTKRDGGIISIGYKVYPFNYGDRVEVKLSDNPLKVLRRKT